MASGDPIPANGGTQGGLTVPIKCLAGQAETNWNGREVSAQRVIVLDFLPAILELHCCTQPNSQMGHVCKSYRCLSLDNLTVVA